MDSILITGGAGFIGSFLAEKLVAEGHHVRVFDNLARGKSENLREISGDIEFLSGSILRKDDVTQALSGVDMVFHLAAINGTRYFYEIPHKVLEVNVLGMVNLLESAANSSVKKIVFSSSSEVYGKPAYFPTDEKHQLVIADPKNPRLSYAGSKIIGELFLFNYAKQYGFKPSIVRYHNIYGPRMGYEHVIPEFIKKLATNAEFTVQGSGNETRAFCFIKDAIEGTYAAGASAKADWEAFNIGNDKDEIQIMDLAKKLFEIHGSKPPVRHLPRLEGSTDRRCPDISKARRLLGYEPKTGLDEGLKATYQWYCKDLQEARK